MSEKTSKFRECVSNKMRILKSEGGRPEDQMVAIALNTCREKFGIKRRTGADAVEMVYIAALGKAIDINMDTYNILTDDE